MYWVGGSVVLGRKFHCTGQEVPLYWAGGSIILDSRFGYTGQWLLRRILFYGRFFLLVFDFFCWSSVIMIELFSNFLSEVD